MTPGSSKSSPAIGFLTVFEHAEHGLFGGYLVLNATGRPLEFHCTAPVRPNRAQQILYGPTLKPYLYGEQIGPTLVAKSKKPPLFICTDCEPILTVREHVSTPVVLVLPRANGDDHTGASLRPDDGQPGVPQPAALRRFTLADRDLAVSAAYSEDGDIVAQRWQPHAAAFTLLDLSEPFGRIREAIEEAQRTAAG